jgi:hypothetical protein
MTAAKFLAAVFLNRGRMEAPTQPDQFERLGYRSLCGSRHPARRDDGRGLSGKFMHAKPTFLHRFSGDILVCCPHCKARAHLLAVVHRTRGGYRLVCSACALERDWVLSRDRVIPCPGKGPRLTGFDVDLWLSVDCCGECLWAYNLEHLDFLAGHIGSKLRLKARDPKYGWSNQDLRGCLPQWMLSRHNRNDVLRG